jgi:hypothetical protein
VSKSGRKQFFALAIEEEITITNLAQCKLWAVDWTTLSLKHIYNARKNSKKGKLECFKIEILEETCKN